MTLILLSKNPADLILLQPLIHRELHGEPRHQWSEKMQNIAAEATLIFDDCAAGVPTIALTCSSSGGITAFCSAEVAAMSSMDQIELLTAMHTAFGEMIADSINSWRKTMVEAA